MKGTTVKNLVLVAALATALAGCSTTTPGTTIAGHPYQTETDCERTEPLGTFDPLCDHPIVGYRGANTSALPSIGGVGGSIGGLSVGGL